MRVLTSNDEICENAFSFLEADELVCCVLACRFWRDTLYSRQLPWRHAYHWMVTRAHVRGTYPISSRVPMTQTQSDSEKLRNDPQVPTWLQKVADVYPVVHGGGVEIEDVVATRFTCRSGHTASVINDELLLLYGGASHLFIFLHTLDVLHMRLNKMLAMKEKPVGQNPSPRWLHTACTIDTQIYIFGGQSDFGFENDLYRFDVYYYESTYTHAGVSTPCPAMRVQSTRIPTQDNSPCPRAGHSSVCVDDQRIVVFGGMTSGQQVLNDVHVFDVGALSWVDVSPNGSRPCERWCHSAVLAGRDVCIFGGWVYGLRHLFLNDVHLLNVDTYTWTCVNTSGPVPRARCQAPCFHVPGVARWAGEGHGYLCVYGGACHNAEVHDAAAYGTLVVDLDDFCLLDLDTYSWLPVKCNFPRCRGGVNAVVKCPSGWLLSGGMHSDPNAHIPRFKNDLVCVRINIGGRFKTTHVKSIRFGGQG